MSVPNYTTEYYANAFLLEIAYETWLLDDAIIDWSDVAASLLYFKRHPPRHPHLRSIVVRLAFILTELKGQ